MNDRTIQTRPEKQSQKTYYIYPKLITEEFELELIN